MAADQETVHKLKKLDNRFTLRVRLIETGEFRLRKYIALLLIRLATVVLGCGLEVDDAD